MLIALTSIPAPIGIVEFERTNGKMTTIKITIIL